MKDFILLDLFFLLLWSSQVRHYLNNFNNYKINQSEEIKPKGSQFIFYPHSSHASNTEGGTDIIVTTYDAH